MKAKKLIALVLSVVMVLLLFSACGGGGTTSTSGTTSQNSTPADTSTPESSAPTQSQTTTDDEGEAPVITILSDGDNTPNADNLVVRELSERTNTKIEWTYVAGSEAEEKRSVMAAGDNLPDLFEIGSLSEGMDFMNGGLLYDLTGLEDKAPNLFANAADLLDLAPANANGIYVIPSGELTYADNLNLRKDWLDNLNMAEPTNLDELYDVYYAFTYNDPDGDGVDDTFGLCANSSIRSFDTIFGAYGIPIGENILLDGTVTTYAKHPHYLDAIKYVRKLMADGLVEPDWLTIPNMDMFGKLWNGTAGAIEWECVGPTNNWMPGRYTEETPPEFCFPIIEGPEGKHGVQAKFPSVSTGVAISSKTKDIDAVLRVLDYLCTDEGKALLYLGVEGTSFNWTDKDNYQFEYLGDYQDSTYQRSDGIYVYFWLYKTKDPFEIHTLNEQTQEGVAQAWDNMLTDEAIDCQVDIQARIDYGSDMDAIIDEMYAALLTADSDDQLQSIYDEHISRWETEGHGTEWEQEITEWYNSTK